MSIAECGLRNVEWEDRYVAADSPPARQRWNLLGVFQQLLRRRT